MWIFCIGKWLWDGKEAEARKWHLVVRREVKSPKKIKYSLSNAESNTSTRRLAYMQAQRYWVERPFQDAKNECGMGDSKGVARRGAPLEPLVLATPNRTKRSRNLLKKLQ
ncbi:MAG: hypothetical protein ACL93V_13335 [Candidatus Electrothrix sp. YB6]